MSLLEEMAQSGDKSLSDMYNSRGSTGRPRSNSAGNAEHRPLQPSASTVNLSALTSAIALQHPEMATSSSLDCCICFSPFYKPVALSCGHKFCTPCLAGMIAATVGSEERGSEEKKKAEARLERAVSEGGEGERERERERERE